MIKKILISAGIVSMLAAPAIAEEATCAAMLEKAAAAAEAVKMDDATKKSFDEMKAKAEEQAKAGDEAGCKATVEEMNKMLGSK